VASDAIPAAARITSLTFMAQMLASGGIRVIGPAVPNFGNPTGPAVEISLSGGVLDPSLARREKFRLEFPTRG
jgi:hypothetical protein